MFNAVGADSCGRWQRGNGLLIDSGNRHAHSGVHRIVAGVMSYDDADERRDPHDDDGGVGGALELQPARSRSATTWARNKGLSRFRRHSLLGSLASL